MYRTTFDGSRQSDVVSPVLTCLSKNGDNVGVGRHVGDMSATYPTKVGRPPEVALLVRYVGLYNQSEVNRDETLTLKCR